MVFAMFWRGFIPWPRSRFAWMEDLGQLFIKKVIGRWVVFYNDISLWWNNKNILFSLENHNIHKIKHNEESCVDAGAMLCYGGLHI